MDVPGDARAAHSSALMAAASRSMSVAHWRKSHSSWLVTGCRGARKNSSTMAFTSGDGRTIAQCGSSLRPGPPILTSLTGDAALIW